MKSDNAIVRIVRYNSRLKQEWDDFVRFSKNGLFMFERAYMDYHADRFRDHSLMVYYKEKLISVLPANARGDILFSHQGLTYGGFITDYHMHQHIMNSLFEELLQYMKSNGLVELVYKTVPYFYFGNPSEEDRYTLFLLGGSISTCGCSSVIDYEHMIDFNNSRNGCIKKASKTGVEVKELEGKPDYSHFMELQNQVLMKYHNTKATHTADELYSLHESFPENIHLFGCFLENDMIAGAVIYEYPRVVHTQYLAVDDEGRKNGGLDYLINYLIQKYKGEKRYFDFGVSTEDGGRVLNEGLISQKEGFGARSVVYPVYSVKIDQ